MSFIWTIATDGNAYHWSSTDFFVKHPQILSLTLQAPYVLHMDHRNGRECIPLEQSELTSRYLTVCKKEPSTMIVTTKTIRSSGMSGTKF